MKGLILIRCLQRSAKRAGAQARASQAWSTAPISGLLMIPYSVLPGLGTLKNFLRELSFSVSIRYSQACPVLGGPSKETVLSLWGGGPGGRRGRPGGEEGEP